MDSPKISNPAQIRGPNAEDILPENFVIPKYLPISFSDGTNSNTICLCEIHIPENAGPMRTAMM